MRINQFLAKNTQLSRRSADQAVNDLRVMINGRPATNGDQVGSTDIIFLDGKKINHASQKNLTIMINKPEGYVCSRKGQGNKTIYDILPENYKTLNTVGRLDKNSSGLLLLTNDGELAHQLTHPSFKKIKIYHIELDQPLAPLHQQMISDFGVQLDDGPSKLNLEKTDNNRKKFTVSMHEGRNRQIRRTFESLGYKVTKLHRTHFGTYDLKDLKSGQLIIVT